MAEDFPDEHGDLSGRHWSRRSCDPREPTAPNDPNDRWPDKMPSVGVARVMMKVDAFIAMKRTAAAAWLTAHGDAVSLLPVKPTRMELAVVIALAETYGAKLYRDAHFVPVLDFIADYGAVVFVQRVMYGARPVTDLDITAYAAENVRFADTVRDAYLGFEALCDTWPEVFLAQTHAALAGVGVRVRRPDAELMPPPIDREDHDAGDKKNNRDRGGEGQESDHA